MNNLIKLKIAEREIYQKELKSTEYVLSEIKDQISDLESDLEQEETERRKLNARITKINMEIDIASLYDTQGMLYNKDDFNAAFLKASLFCNHYDVGRESLQLVKVTDNYLMGTDGFTAIKQQCSTIPEEIKNTLLRWDTTDFSQRQLPQVTYPDVEKFLDMKLRYTKEYDISDIKSILEDGKRKDDDRSWRAIVESSLGSVEFLFDELFIKRAFAVLPDDGKVNVSWDNPTSPITLKTDKTEVLIMPIRLPKDK